ncbi:MAG TPA: cellulose binding domain-containing protein, partial [Bacillota bacterium]|nr:cellulose binding domain-containing protein [Bacillota bacterium]
EEGASSYFFWDLIWAPGQRPLVEVENPSGQSSWTSSKGYTISDFYYVFKQFAKFTDPGFKRVAATANSSDIRTTAFVSPDQNQLSIILINNGSTQSTVSLNLNGYSAANATVYRTIPGGSEKCANVGTLGAENTVTLPAQSIATVVITKGSTVTPSPTSTIIVPTLPPTTTATSTPSPTPTSVLGCAVSYTMYDWGSGATVSITIKNNGATAINGWTLAWDFPGNQKITNLWNGSYTQNGTAVAVKNLSYNGTIPAKGSVNFGFNIAYSGSNAKPTGFTLNGTACSVQ